MGSQDIFDYYDWLGKVYKVVEDAVIARTKNPNDTTLVHDTDELYCLGYSLKGQDIETSSATGNVFIQPTLLTFASWLKQKEQLYAK